MHVIGTVSSHEPEKYFCILLAKQYICMPRDTKAQKD